MRLVLMSIPLLALACTADEKVDTPDINDSGSEDTADIDIDTGDDSDTGIDEDIDADGDGVLSDLDCDDNNPDIGSIEEDGDCDGVITQYDCDDSDPDASYLYTYSDTDYETDGVLDTIYEHYELLNEAMNPFFGYSVYDGDGDGQSNIAVTTESLYDPEGNLVDHRSYYDFLGQDNYSDTHTVYSYDAEGGYQSSSHR